MKTINKIMLATAITFVVSVGLHSMEQDPFHEEQILAEKILQDQEKRLNDAITELRSSNWFQRYLKTATKLQHICELKEGYINAPIFSNYQPQKYSNFIDLSNCQINGNKLVVLSDALTTNKSLRHLDLSNNQIDLHGFFFFSNAIKKNRTLITLNLSNNQINNFGLHGFIRALQENYTLLEINLSGNNLTEEQAQEIKSLLERNQKINPRSDV